MRFWRNERSPADEDLGPGPAAASSERGPDSVDQERGGYVTDAPITEALDDKFSRAPFAERIAHTILSQRDPASIVVGVYGPWGDGKTSVLNLIEHALADDERTVPIRFNPWRLGGETEMFVGFFETLAEAVQAKLATGREPPWV